MNSITYSIKKAQLWQEIKSLEQEYKRNISAISKLEARQSDVSFQIQKKLDTIQKLAERYDEHQYRNKLGEFSE